MAYGFLRTAAAVPPVVVAQCTANADTLIAYVRSSVAHGASLTVFPELCITGYSCGDLFFQQTLLTAAITQLFRIADATADCSGSFVVGLPVMYKGALYNAAAVVSRGEILGIVPKSFIPNYGEFYEARYFAPSFTGVQELTLCSGSHRAVVPFGTDILFVDSDSGATFAVELCEDMWTMNPPSVRHVAAGAQLIANTSASNEIIGKSEYRKTLAAAQSGRLACGYVYANCGTGESTTDVVFSGHSFIVENGTILAELSPFSCLKEDISIVYADVDLERIAYERRHITTFASASESVCALEHTVVYVSLPELNDAISLERTIEPRPFIPSRGNDLQLRCREVLTLQAAGLYKRLVHTHAKSAVIGLSGGLDSTLALLVTVQAFRLCGLDLTGITAVTMPCFGTTDRTYHNAVQMAQALGVTLREIPIQKAVRQHFADIGHDESDHSVTYENSQARERTQILMDIANQMNGLVIGTGDLSEMALGWATYNGDHMSMYAVNASVPKTLVRHLVRYWADAETAPWQNGNGENVLRDTLLDILATPVSPELLPPDGNDIAQKTEDIVGPYDLHDFFLYYLVRWGFCPRKIVYLAEQAFDSNEYPRDVIIRWLKTFCRRFFSQQFKRSCMPDGVKVGSVSLSPRGDWRMPSDADASLWLQDIEGLE